MRLFKELYKIEFDNDQKNIYSVKIRDIDGTNKTKNFDSSEEADSYFDGLDKKEDSNTDIPEHLKGANDIIIAAAKEAIEIVEELNEEGRTKLINDKIRSIEDEIRSYASENKNKQGVTSARHLNAQFKLDPKLSQKEINEILGLNESK